VVRLKDAQSDIGEAPLSQLLGDDPHVFDGPNPVSVSGGNPGPWTTGAYGVQSYVPVEHSQVGEHRFVSRQIRRGIAGEREPGGEDMRTIDTNAGNLQNLSDACHDVPTILSGFAWALPNQPYARDTHRIGRERDEPFSLGLCVQAEDRQRAFASSSVKEDQQRQCAGFVVPRKVVGSLPTCACRGLHGARQPRPAPFWVGRPATLHQHEETKQQDGGASASHGC